MRVLALDTTTRAGSVALVDDDRVVDERARRRGAHARRAAAAASSRALGAPVCARDIDLFAVASGPGSFTGLRIGIATMQGLAFVHGRRDRRRLGARGARAAGQPIGRRRARSSARGWTRSAARCSAALYAWPTAPPFTRERLVEIEGAGRRRSVAHAGATGRAIRSQSAVFVGDGARALRRACCARHARTPGGCRAPMPLAGAIGCMAAVRAARGLAVDRRHRHGRCTSGGPTRRSARAIDRAANV